MNIGDVLDALTDFMAADRLIFVATATTWLRSLMVLMLAYTALQMALQRDYDPWRLIRLFLLYLGIWSIIHNWQFLMQTATGEVAFLRTLVEHGQESAVFETVTKISTDVQSAKPILPSISDWIVIYLLEIVLAIFEAAIYFVLTFGYIAAALCEVVGPLFLALTIIPGMAWIGLGWFRSFIGYALYPLFGALYADIVARVLTFFMAAHPAPWSAADLAVMLAGFIMMLVGLVVGVWRLPSFIGDVLGGRVGTSAVPHFLVRRF